MSGNKKESDITTRGIELVSNMHLINARKQRSNVDDRQLRGTC